MDQRSDRGAEQALLAACMMTKTAREEARKHIVSSDFDEPRHEAIWSAMSQLDRHGKAVDPTTVHAAMAGNRGAVDLLPGLVTMFAPPDSVADYATIIRGWSVKRQFEHAARIVLQDVGNANLTPSWATTVVNRFTVIRDASVSEDITALMLGELLDQADDEPEWLIPGLLERRDRLILTGEEGLGKSHMLRQLAIYSAAGLHPFTLAPIEPIRATILDCENSWSQVRRKARPMAEYATEYGQDPRNQVMVECIGRIDITRDKDLSRIHQLLDVQQPDLVIIGPLYRLTNGAIQTDDEAAPILAALDTIRERGCALLTEAHAGHAVGKGGTRDMRPRGSSALMGWPEFGYGLRSIGAEGYCDLVPWRGNREERDWPQRMVRGDGFRWKPYGETRDAWSPTGAIA